jgi:SAM-dependent methyltransferase
MSSATEREQFRAWVDCLLDEAAPPFARREAAYAWCQWGLAALGVDANDSMPTRAGFAEATMLPTGKAISPLGAARCLWEYQRTSVFLRALEAAVEEASRRFPGETIHVVEAGCGPLAPLALALAVRHPRERVQVTLLDLHADSLECARQIAVRLGLEDRVRACVAADAVTYRFAEEERPHVIVCEVLLRALKTEPQVAATLNLAPQLRPGGIFLPERIDVHACLFESGKYYRPASENFDLAAVRAESITELGCVFSLAAERVAALENVGSGRLRAGAVDVPPHPGRRPLELFTRLQVLREHRLGDFDSSLNLPEKIGYPEQWRTTGGRGEFYYEISSTPGLRLAASADGPLTGAAPSDQMTRHE